MLDTDSLSLHYGDLGRLAGHHHVLWDVQTSSRFLGDAMAAYVWSVEGLKRLGFLLCSRGFENEDEEEEESDGQDEETKDDEILEEKTPPPQSGRRVAM